MLHYKIFYKFGYYCMYMYIGKYNNDDVKAFIKESFRMKGLNHINVMRLVGVCLDADTTPYVVLPYMAG